MKKLAQIMPHSFKHPTEAYIQIFYAKNEKNKNILGDIAFCKSKNKINISKSWLVMHHESWDHNQAWGRREFNSQEGLVCWSRTSASSISERYLCDETAT